MKFGHMVKYKIIYRFLKLPNGPGKKQPNALIGKVFKSKPNKQEKVKFQEKLETIFSF